MKVKDFQGNEHNWPPGGHRVFQDDRRPRSQYHLRCRTLLHKLYPADQILEELPIPKLGLYLDFYLPLRLLAIEVNGEQHYKFNPFFHNDRFSFAKAVHNDNQKLEWCNLNNIRLVCLDWNKDDTEWTKFIHG